MLLAPESTVTGLEGIPLLQAAMEHHIGGIGSIFVAVSLWLFCFSTFIGILYYARSNVAYLFGESWRAQTVYKLLALVMLFIGGLATYTFVWELGDISVGLMTIFNMIVLLPMGGEAIRALKDYTAMRKEQRSGSWME
jgi:AGCS family alanine or glycine:cation symporter